MSLAVALVGWLVLRPALDVPAVVAVGPVRVFESTTVQIPVTNKSWGIPAKVDRVTTSCGCTYVDVVDLTLRPRETAYVTARIEPRLHDREVSSEISVTDSWGVSSKVLLKGSVTSPFDGWPDRLVASHDSRGYWRAQLDPAYRQRVSAVLILPAAGVETAGTIDEESGELFLFRDDARPAADRVEVSLAFNTKATPNWTGWLILK